MLSEQYRDFGNIGIDGKPVYTICYNDIAAVVSIAGDVTIDRPAAERQHRDALNKNRSQVAIFPMDYRDNLTSSDIKRILTGRYTHLKVHLARLDGNADIRMML